MAKGKRAAGKNPNGAIYLFCLARSRLLPQIEGKGVDGHSPLFVRRFLDIAAVLSAASIEEFCGASAESKMQDLSWVGSRACRHEEIVEEVMRHSPVLPVRFATIFSSVERLEQVLKKHRSAISGFLDWVADKDEWAVKGILDRPKAKEKFFSAALAANGENLASSSAGTRYLQEQRIRARIEEELNCWLKRTCKAVADDLRSHASDCRVRKVLSSGTDGTDMLVNWAFLVSRDSVCDFRGRIARASARHAKKGLVFEVSGPWPPYSFCPSLGDESDR